MVSLISSLVVGDSVITQGRDKAKKVSGQLASALAPGNIVYQSAAGTWTASTGIASEGCYLQGVVEYMPRTSSTFGEVNIDASYSNYTAINVEIIVGPLDGTVECAVKCKDFGVTCFYGHPVIDSSAGKADGDVTTAKFEIGFVGEDGYTSGDTVVKIFLGGGV